MPSSSAPSSCTSAPVRCCDVPCHAMPDDCGQRALHALAALEQSPLHWPYPLLCQCAAGETGEDIKPTLHYLYKNGIGGILDYAAEDDVQSEGGPASREPENEHIIARTFDYESEVGC
jgi:hypothetical protein